MLLSPCSLVSPCIFNAQTNAGSFEMQFLESNSRNTRDFFAYKKLGKFFTSDFFGWLPCVDFSEIHWRFIQNLLFEDEKIKVSIYERKIHNKRAASKLCLIMREKKVSNFLVLIYATGSCGRKFSEFYWKSNRGCNRVLEIKANSQKSREVNWGNPSTFWHAIYRVRAES